MWPLYQLVIFLKLEHRTSWFCRLKVAQWLKDKLLHIGDKKEADGGTDDMIGKFFRCGEENSFAYGIEVHSLWLTLMVLDLYTARN